MSFDHFTHVENLARIVGHLDDDPIVPPPSGWGPASWWRIGLVVMAVMIAVLALWPAFG